MCLSVSVRVVRRSLVESATRSRRAEVDIPAFLWVRVNFPNLIGTEYISS